MVAQQLSGFFSVVTVMLVEQVVSFYLADYAQSHSLLADVMARVVFFVVHTLTSFVIEEKLHFF